MYFVLFDAELFGVVRRSQLLARGLDDRSILRMVRTGELRRRGAGVYLCGPAPEDRFDQWRQHCAEQLVAHGPDAVLAGPAAATLWNFDGFEAPVPIILNVLRRSGHRGAHSHRTAALHPATERRGLPVTTVAQTLVELGRGLQGRRVVGPGGRLGPWLEPTDLVELALESALRMGAVTESDLLALVRTLAPQRAGLAVLDEVLQRRGAGVPATESYLETRAVQVLRSGGLPTAVRQHIVRDEWGRFVARVDLLLGPSVIIEVDGRGFHDTSADSFAEDRRRWTRLTELGYRVGVFTYDHVEFQPGSLCRHVRGLLALA